MSNDGQETKLALIYQQHCEDFRSLNNIFWRVPILAMAITGGLGFAIGTFNLNPVIQQALLYFVALCNVGFIIILWRLRVSVMESLLAQICEYEGRAKSGSPFRVMSVFAIIMGVAASFAFYAAVHHETVLAPKPPKSSLLPLRSATASAQR